MNVWVESIRMRKTETTMNSITNINKLFLIIDPSHGHHLPEVDCQKRVCVGVDGQGFLFYGGDNRP